MDGGHVVQNAADYPPIWGLLLSWEWTIIHAIEDGGSTPSKNEEWTKCANWVIYRLLSLPMGRFPAHFFLHTLVLQGAQMDKNQERCTREQSAS